MGPWSEGVANGRRRWRRGKIGPIYVPSRRREGDVCTGTRDAAFNILCRYLEIQVARGEIRYFVIIDKIIILF